LTVILCHIAFGLLVALTVLLAVGFGVLASLAPLYMEDSDDVY